MSDLKWDFRFMALAKEVSSWSKDPSTKVGAVIVRRDNTVASLGFNGFPMGMEDSKEYLENREEKYSRVIHAEMNALLHCREPVRFYTLYTYPFLPCDRCFVHMVQAGIRRVVTYVPTEEALSRWKASFDKTKKYADEMGIEIDEY